MLYRDKGNGLRSDAYSHNAKLGVWIVNEVDRATHTLQNGRRVVLDAY